VTDALSIHAHREHVGAEHRSRVVAIRRVLAMEVVSGLGDGIFWVGLATLLVDRGPVRPAWRWRRSPGSGRVRC